MNPSKEFDDICKRIESDQNYGRSMKPCELQYIACNKLQAGQKATTLESQEVRCNLGKFYNVLEVRCQSASCHFTEFGWAVSTTQILVHYNGHVSFFSGADVIYQKPLADLSLEQFLGRDLLVTENMKGLVKFAMGRG